jgi:RsiW-degrading membrane proteinase PrsW (M82 family)
MEAPQETQAVEVPTQEQPDFEIPEAEKKPPRATAWIKAFVSGVVLFILSGILLITTQNPNLFPTVVMIGSFLMPVTYVTFFYERRHLSKLSVSTTFISFVYGGILGVLAASLLEPLFIHRIDFGSTMEVGLIEEFAKILAVIIIAYRLPHDSEMNGLILGAAVGMGFAALETTGYAFTTFISSDSLSQTVFVTGVRGLLSPVGHGTWTAILASILFREARNGRFRINPAVIGAYLLVSILHGLWDGLPPVITAYLGSGLDVIVGQIIIGGAGLFILWLRWRDARRMQIETTEPPQ